MRIPHKRQSGQVLIMVALSAVVLIASAGLAIDSALGYFVKAKLNAAVDSASLAAARGVTLGDTQAAQATNARQSAKEFFNINYPDKFLLSTPVLNPVGVVFDRGTVTIDVSATASMPVSLMGILGFKTLNVAASAQTIRKDLDMVLVMDTSGSLSSNAAAVRAAGKSFLNKFNSTVDRIGLLHFSSGTVIDLPIKKLERGFNRTQASTAIDNYSFSGNTNYSEGMWRAREQLNGISQSDRSSLRVIVFFSDGAPTALSSYFFPATSGNCTEAGALAVSATRPAKGRATSGLYRIDAAAQSIPSNWCAASLINKLPAWYNAHQTKAQADAAAPGEFPITTNTPRKVTADISIPTLQYDNVHRAARNLPEAMASKSRLENTYIFTLGMGAGLKAKEGPDYEVGEDLLRCMANTADAPMRCRKPAEPVGLYCYAATESDLSPCFTRLASAILRISK